MPTRTPPAGQRLDGERLMGRLHDAGLDVEYIWRMGVTPVYDGEVAVHLDPRCKPAVGGGVQHPARGAALSAVLSGTAPACGLCVTSEPLLRATRVGSVTLGSLLIDAAHTSALVADAEWMLAVSSTAPLGDMAHWRRTVRHLETASLLGDRHHPVYRSSSEVARRLDAYLDELMRPELIEWSRRWALWASTAEPPPLRRGRGRYSQERAASWQRWGRTRPGALRGSRRDLRLYRMWGELTGLDGGPTTLVGLGRPAGGVTAGLPGARSRASIETEAALTAVIGYCWKAAIVDALTADLLRALAAEAGWSFGAAALGDADSQLAVETAVALHRGGLACAEAVTSAVAALQRR
jgi:hypothetical protein